MILIFHRAPLARWQGLCYIDRVKFRLTRRLVESHEMLKSEFDLGHPSLVAPSPSFSEFDVASRIFLNRILLSYFF